MSLYEFTAPCHFGMEAVLKREIINLGYEIVRVEDGRVSFCGDASAIARANVFLRTAERVLLCVGRFKAYTYDELFEGSLGYFEESGFTIERKTYDLHAEPIWENNIETEHEKMFSEQGIKIKALIAKNKRREK